MVLLWQGIHNRIHVLLMLGCHYAKGKNYGYDQFCLTVIHAPSGRRGRKGPFKKNIVSLHLQLELEKED